MNRRMLAFLVCGLVLGGCGGGTSTTEYVEQLNSIPSRYAEQFTAAWNDYLAVEDPTLDDLRMLLGADAEMRRRIQADIDAIEPPRHFADTHTGFSAWHASYVAANDAMEVKARTVATWDEFIDSSELAAVTRILRDGIRLCQEMEGELDSTDAKAFEGTPWMPGDLTSAVQAAIGCDVIPEDYAAAFRR